MGPGLWSYIAIATQLFLNTMPLYLCLAFHLPRHFSHGKYLVPSLYQLAAAAATDLQTVKSAAAIHNMSHMQTG